MEAVSKGYFNLIYLCKFYGLQEVAEYWEGVLNINYGRKIEYLKQSFKNFSEL